MLFLKAIVFLSVARKRDCFGQLSILLVGGSEFFLGERSPHPLPQKNNPSLELSKTLERKAANGVHLNFQ